MKGRDSVGQVGSCSLYPEQPKASYRVSLPPHSSPQRPPSWYHCLQSHFYDLILPPARTTILNHPSSRLPPP
jgi:hypothetical protein